MFCMLVLMIRCYPSEHMANFRLNLYCSPSLYSIRDHLIVLPILFDCFNERFHLFACPVNVGYALLCKLTENVSIRVMFVRLNLLK